MPLFKRDGLIFNYVDIGDGVPFVFQHGMGGDVHQPTGIYIPQNERLLAFDCRGHGGTTPLGDVNKLSFADFADDLIALLDYLKIQQAVIGGISMGAGVALNTAIRYPHRASALVLSRPAWLWQAAPDNLAVYTLIAKLLRMEGPETGLASFIKSDIYHAIQVESPDAANSLVGQFTNPRALETVDKLERMPNDAPAHSEMELRKIQMPVLVMASRQDPIHPFDFGMRLSDVIPGARFEELTPKSMSQERHRADVQRFVSSFISQLRL
ncbi:MAG TPA: alpha/beta hydrolase [Anaerolineae bacterium]